MSNPQKGMSLFDSYGQQIGFLPVGINFHMPTVDSSDGIISAGAPNTALQVGGVDATTGLLHPIAVTASGVVIVIDEQYAYAASTKTFSANTGAAAVNVTGSKPIISISPKNGATTIIFTIKTMQAHGNGARIFYQVVLNGTLIGANFVSVNANSNMNMDTSATSISGGTVVDSGYLQLGPLRQDYQVRIGITSGIPDILTLRMVQMGSGAIPISASFTWTERTSI